MARNWITAQGYVPETPRFVAEVGNHPRFGRTLRIRDNFPHLSDPNEWSVKTVFRCSLTEGQKVLPVLAREGYRLAGNWRANRSTAYARVEKI